MRRVRSTPQVSGWAWPSPENSWSVREAGSRWTRAQARGRRSASIYAGPELLGVTLQPPRTAPLQVVFRRSRYHRAVLIRSVLGIVLFAVFTVPAAAGAPERTAQLTLPEAVQLALRTNPSIRAKQREHEATRAGETTPALLPNPTASYLAEQLGSSGVSPQYTVSVSQTIETGGKRSRR